MADRLIPPILPETPVYTSCWCEENIYLLGKHLIDSGGEDFVANWDAFVVFISNADKSVRCIRGMKSILPLIR